MPLTLEEVRHIAKLARLRLSPDEEQRYQEQLSDILDYAARLQSVDTGHIAPTASVLQLDAPLADDEPRPCLPPEALLANAPEADRGMFKVPPILDGAG
ncbi:MAG TPA: Asp-tRNA(Asn)/Glu-tRNA(Gln) amidotransferase subunit GatC [Anaerolineales bacterium]|jgi:aspartyl-tRNA(Asn)/glutamyl-tRNA(Gln) amidotransferase subunit C